MADILEKLSTEDLELLQSGKLENMSDAGLAIVSKLPPEQNYSSKDARSSLLAQGGATTLGLVGGGSAIIGLKAFENWRNQPRNTRDMLVKQVQLEQSQLGMPSDMPLSSLPKKYGQKISRARSDLSSKINTYNTISSGATKKLQSQLSNFEDTVLNAKIDIAAQTIKTQAPNFFKSAYEGYGAGLEAAEGFMADKGVSLTNKDLGALLGAIRDKAIQNGVPENKLVGLLKAENSLTPQQVDITAQIGLKRAKNIINNVVKDLDKNTQYEVRAGWGKLLETVAPKEVSEQLSLLNKNYEPITQVRNTINSLSALKKGEFEDKGIYNLLKDFAKKGEDASTTNLTKLLSEGNDITSGIEGLGKQIQAVKEAGVTSKNLERIIKNISQSKQARLKVIRETAKKEIDNLVSLKEKSVDLVDRIRVAQKKVDKRSILNKIPGVKGVISKGLPALGVAPQALQLFELWRLRNDPEAQYNAMLGGGELAPKGQMMNPNIGNEIMTTETFEKLRKKGINVRDLQMGRIL